MLNSINNSFELFKVQLKWNAKSISFWLTIGIYILMSTGISLAFGIIGTTLFERGDLNDGTVNEMFTIIAIICHVIMASILISSFSVKVFFNNFKHKVVELEKNAGYNKFAIFFSRLTWLMTTIFSTIIINLLISTIFFMALNKPEYSDFLYGIFIGLFGWEIVFSLIYLLLFLVILFLLGPTKSSLLVIVILFILNMAPIQNVSGARSDSRQKELRWTVDNSLWFKNDDSLTDPLIEELYNYFNHYNFTYFGYDYSRKINGTGGLPEYKKVESFYNTLKVLTKDIKWSKEDVYIYEKGIDMKVTKTIYDFKDEWFKLNRDDIYMNEDNKLAFQLFDYYLSELETLDSVWDYKYEYYNYSYKDYNNKLDEVYGENAAMVYESTIVHNIFSAHRAITSKMVYQVNENEKPKTVVAKSYSEYIKNNPQSNEWYIEFNPTKSETLAMVFNPFTHIGLMQKASTGLSVGLKEAIAYTNLGGTNALYSKNIKIEYNKDGSFKGYKRIIHTEWIFIFYTLLSIILLPLTYLLWRRKNK